MKANISLKINYDEYIINVDSCSNCPMKVEDEEDRNRFYCNIYTEFFIDSIENGEEHPNCPIKDTPYILNSFELHDCDKCVFLGCFYGRGNVMCDISKRIYNDSSGIYDNVPNDCPIKNKICIMRKIK